MPISRFEKYFDNQLYVQKYLELCLEKNKQDASFMFSESRDSERTFFTEIFILDEDEIQEFTPELKEIFNDGSNKVVLGLTNDGNDNFYRLQAWTKEQYAAFIKSKLVQKL